MKQFKVIIADGKLEKPLILAIQPELILIL